MKTIIQVLVIGVFFLLCHSSCKTTMPVTSEVQYLGNPNDGVVTINAMGYGKKDEDAKANAFTMGFKTLLFRGIPGFSPLQTPMIADESKARSANPSFFTNFFDNKGYMQFVTKQEETQYIGKTDDKKSRRAKQTFSINYKQLRKHLEQNNVIRKFGL